MMVIALVLAAYLVGAIPTSLLIARRVRGIDLREFGSGNVGATNLYRAVGLGYALMAGLFDIAKGLVPAWLFPAWDGVDAGQLALAYGGAAVFGHIFSVFVRFRGGKGVATGAGVYLALAPSAVGLAALVWMLVVAATRIVSVGSLSAATALPALVWLARRQLDFVFWSTWPLVALVWWTHRSNIVRLLAGREPRTARASSEPAPQLRRGRGGSGGNF